MCEENVDTIIMITIPVYNQEGKEIDAMQLSEKVFGVSLNHVLVHQVYTVLSGNLRSVIAHTKDRSERSGSGRKLWKQKGTGRARVGSVRSPLWRKGGITFGPTNERNFKRIVNVKMRRLAVAMLLSEKLKSGMLSAFDTFNINSEKTKDFSILLSRLNTQSNSVLVGISEQEKGTMRSMRNIANVTVMMASDMNAKDLLDHTCCILSRESAHDLEKRLVE